MNANEYNLFLKNRRTYKYFDTGVVIPDDHRQLLIEASNLAPAQNCNKNFIPILVEDTPTKEWFLEHVFYMVERSAPGRSIPKEYQMGVGTASSVFVYLEANRNFPISGRQGAEGEIITEPDNGDIAIRNINLGMNMAFLANQAYMLGYDVGFVGCSRGVRNVFDIPELRDQLFDIFDQYGIREIADQFKLAPSYAVCVGRALPMDIGPAANKMYPWKDGMYTNRKKQKLDPIEFVRTKL